MPLWGGNSWRLWVDTEGGLIEGKIVYALARDYLAKQSAKETDLFIPFVHLMWQQASYPAIIPQIVAISDYFHNLGTSVAKRKHFWKFQGTLSGAERRNSPPPNLSTWSLSVER
jgi:hypothetical protein